MLLDRTGQRSTIFRNAQPDPSFPLATPVAGAVAGLDAAVQNNIVADVRDALGAYREGGGLAAPIEAHLAIAHR